MTWAVDWRGPKRQWCGSCDRGPKDRSLGVDVGADGSGVAHCFRCGFVETHRPYGRALYRPGKAPPRAVATMRRTTLSDAGRELFAACRPLSGTVAAEYLIARGCVVPPADGDLRFHPSLAHPSGYCGPAIVALITHLRTRAPMSLHRTWIRPDGMKADVTPPRLLLAGHAKAEGVIRLWADEDVSTGLGIAEGIETALSLAHAFKPALALIDAGNLAAFPALPGIEALTIAVDHDPAGQKAAGACAERWTRAGATVRLVLPPAAGADLNDVASEVLHA